MFRYALHGNYEAPIGTPTSILDVGSGTGRWAMEMATEFPLANVIGLDPVVPSGDDAETPKLELDKRPENYAFVQGNVLEGLPFADASFNFVHQRLLIAALPPGRWQWVVSELLRV